MVYQRSDPNKIELIAKRVGEGSNRLAILEYLDTRRLRSLHVISLIEAILPITREWLILPELHSISDQRLMNSGNVASRPAWLGPHQGARISSQAQITRRL